MGRVVFRQKLSTLIMQNNAIKVIYDGIILAVGPSPTKVKNFLYNYSSVSATESIKFDTNGDLENLNLSLKTY